MSDPLARYSFLPFLRRGLAGRIPTVDTLGAGSSTSGPRARFELSLTVNHSAGVAKAINLVGPGDLLGIDARAVVRTDPRRGVSDFEPNYLAAIEFYEEDFAWRYTPAKGAAGHRLRPWIALIVLREDELSEEPAGTPLPAVRVPAAAALFPPVDQLWAWAHVHVNQDLLAAGGEAAALASIDPVLDADPDRGLSRLLSPRRLRPNTGYHALVIPTFESGRLAGLGLPIPGDLDGLAPAWGAGQDRFPVYYRWAFRTGQRGDFEYLVRLLEPRMLDPRVGIRDMDVTAPGAGLPGITAPPVLGLEGALQTLQTRSTEWPDPAPFQIALTQLLNRAEDQRTDVAAAADPVVTPPISGRWHAALARLAGYDPPWIDELNLDPRSRAASGLGTRVIQDQQESLMREAWRQVGDVLEANRRLVRAQLAREASGELRRRHLEGLEPEALLAITAPVHGRIKGSPVTVRKLVGDSRIGRTLVDPGFRRITRARGPVARRAGLAPGEVRLVARVNAGEIAGAPAVEPPARVVAMDGVANGLLPAWVPAWLAAAARRGPVVLLVLLGLFALVVALTGALPLAAVAVIAGVTLAAAAGLAALSGRAAAAAQLRESALTPENLRAVPPRPDFRIVARGVPAVTGAGAGADSAEAAAFREAGEGLHLQLRQDPAAAVRPALALGEVRTTLLEALDPRRTVPRRMRAVVDLTRLSIPGRRDDIDPIMAAPELRRPMYEPLRDLSPELLIPNLELIPQNTIALLRTNRRFIEAYMVGLNHEMARELLWREYPTDQRGSYFRQFWDVRDSATPSPDIAPIHAWDRSSHLGAHDPRPGGAVEQLVLVIRGDLLRKYPTAVITAVQAVWPADGTSRALGEVEKTPLFHAEIGPDMTFLGFDLDAAQARGTDVPADGTPGWFFVIRQRPGEPRFGLDIADGPAAATATTWDDLSWGHLAAAQPDFDALEMIDLARPLHNVVVTPAGNPDGVAWASQAADMAYILHQDPVLVAVHASEMISNREPV